MGAVVVVTTRPHLSWAGGQRSCPRSVWSRSLLGPGTWRDLWGCANCEGLLQDYSEARRLASHSSRAVASIRATQTGKILSCWSVCGTVRSGGRRPDVVWDRWDEVLAGYEREGFSAGGAAGV